MDTAVKLLFEERRRRAQKEAEERARAVARMTRDRRMEVEAEHIFQALQKGRRPYPPRPEPRLSWWRRLVRWARGFFR